MRFYRTSSNLIINKWRFMKTSEILKATLLLVPAIAWAEGNNEQKKNKHCVYSLR